MRRPVSRGMRYAPNDRRAQGAKERRPAMQEISTMQASGSDIFAGQQLTIGLDLGDRSSNYCVMNAAGDILLEDKLPTTSQAMKQLFGRMLRSRIAMETLTIAELPRDAQLDVGEDHERRSAAEPFPLWSNASFAINVLPLKTKVKQR